MRLKGMSLTIAASLSRRVAAIILLRKGPHAKVLDLEETKQGFSQSLSDTGGGLTRWAHDHFHSRDVPFPQIIG